MSSGRITSTPSVQYLPNGWAPVRTWECTQRGDVWSEVVAENAARAAIQQARVWMTLGYRLPMFVHVRAKGGQEIVRYRVAACELAATLVESDKESYEIVRLEK